MKYFKLLFILLVLSVETSFASNIEEEFKNSPKFLVHIGFEDGLPSDGIMKPSSWDPCLYFSLNSPFPSTKLMPKLDKSSFVIVLPLTEDLLKKTVSFHPIEVLLVGSIDLIKHKATIVCPHKSKIPAIFNKNTIKFYDKKELIKNRTLEVLEYIRSEKGFPSEIILDQYESWNDNSEVYIHHKENNQLNINKKDLYPDVYSGIHYGVPASCQIYNTEWEFHKIGFLSEIKSLKLGKNNQEIISKKAIEFRNWVNELKHIQKEEKEAFFKDLEIMITPRSNCTIF